MEVHEDLSLDVIKQHFVECPRESDKEEVLKNRILPACDKLGQTIVFVKQRKAAKRLHMALHEAGWKCTSISGDMQFEERDRVIDEFRKGLTKILIATDVLSRGFDQSTVTLVVNYDMPVTRDGHPAFETYLHRIGRSGRFGLKGAAFNLVWGAGDKRINDMISRHFDHHIKSVPYDSDDTFETVLQEAGLMSRDD
uniref:Helicase C-terminal domain-containing protein n=1 Tax=Pyramimonas obovata TaxID=1411642 RepID=A0A7S0R1G1_9CHLO